MQHLLKQGSIQIQNHIGDYWKNGGNAANEPTLGQKRREEVGQKHQQAEASQAMNNAQCATWQAEVDRLEPHRRVFFTNEEGETERMDDVERANNVAQLKSQIVKNCN